MSSLAVLTYHRIGYPDRTEGLDGDVIDTTPEEFAEQLEVVKAHGTVVSMSDVRLFQKGRKLPPNPVMITFDDGYVDCSKVAAPILRRAGVPATFFIPTAFPGAGSLFWWDRVSLTMHRCTRDRVELSYPRPLELHPRTDPVGAARRVCKMIKATPGIDLTPLWDDLERATGVTISASEERAIADRTIMSWDEIRALDAAGMEVQSHAHSHLVLNTLSPEGARRDLERSSEVLRDMMGRPTRSVAYPVGYELAGAHKRAPEAAGFELGFTNNTGLCSLDRFDPMNVPRVAMDVSSAGAFFKVLLLLGDRRSPRSFEDPTIALAA